MKDERLVEYRREDLGEFIQSELIGSSEEL